METKVKRAATSVWLIGETDEKFNTSKLPSKEEVLKVMFHFHIGEKLSLKESVDKTSSLILSIWDMARIPTKARYHVIEHIRKLHAEWQGLKKCINRKSTKNFTNQQMFQDRLADLFDIAHQDAMSLILFEEDRLFLEAQREEGRRGTIAGVDRNLVLKEKRTMKRKASAANCSMKIKQAAVTSSVSTTPSRADIHEGHDYDDGPSLDNSSFTLSPDHEEGPSTSKSIVRSIANVITPEVAAALDRTNTSNRKAAHIFSAMATSGLLQCNPQRVGITPSAIRRARMKHRTAFSA